MKKEPTPPVIISPFDTKVIDGEMVSILIPQCCREGWKNCPHVVKKQKPVKRNIGL